LWWQQIRQTLIFFVFFVWINMRMVCLSTSIRSWANFELGIFLALYGQGLTGFKGTHFFGAKSTPLRNDPRRAPEGVPNRFWTAPLPVLA
jgi:hypothetical protein